MRRTFNIFTFFCPNDRKEAPTPERVIELKNFEQRLNPMTHGDPFEFLQGGMTEHTMQSKYFREHWASEASRLHLSNTHLSNAKAVCTYYTSHYDFLLTRLQEALELALKALDRNQYDRAIRYLKNYQRIISLAELPLPTAHWQAPIVLGGAILCQQNQHEQATLLLESVLAHGHENSDASNAARELLTLMHNHNNNQLNELCQQSIKQVTTVCRQHLGSIDHFHKINLQAACQLSAFSPQKNHIVRMCNLIASGKRHPNEILLNQVHVENQLAQLCVQYGHTAHLLTALFHYELYRFYQEYEQDHPHLESHLKTAVDQLKLADMTQTASAAATDRALHITQQSETSHFSLSKQRALLEKHCLFKIAGDLPSTLEKLEAKYQQQFAPAARRFSM